MEGILMLKSPLPWIGGKYYMVKDLLPLIPPHKTYVEPCGGMASLLLAKDPSPVEVYNDIDSGLVNFFRCCGFLVKIRGCSGSANRKRTG